MTLLQLENCLLQLCFRHVVQYYSAKTVKRYPLCPNRRIDNINDRIDNINSASADKLTFSIFSNNFYTIFFPSCKLKDILFVRVYALCFGFVYFCKCVYVFEYHSVLIGSFIVMAIGTGGRGGGALPPPHILPTQKIKSLNITTYKSLYSNKAKIGSYSSGYLKNPVQCVSF